jgi:soluble lytic murein transglycosylase-like protein
MIKREAESRGLDPDLVRAIMYMETSRGHYGTIPEFFGLASSYQPMNIRPDPWQHLGVSSEKIKNNPSENVKVGAELLARIRDRLPNPTPDRIATLYNSLAKDSVTDYGARVARLMEEIPRNRR